MGSDPKFLRELAAIVIMVADRPPSRRGPWIFDEKELQQNAANARRYLALNPTGEPTDGK